MLKMCKKMFLCREIQNKKAFQSKDNSTYFLTGLGSGFQLNKFEQVHVVGVAVLGGLHMVRGGVGTRVRRVPK